MCIINDKNSDQNPPTGDTPENENTPFVNEECGDTMWNEVLSEAEERLKKALPKKNDAVPEGKTLKEQEDHQ